MSLPHPEHPRPDFMRQPWLNLNGEWHFRFDPRWEGEQRQWYRTGAVSRSGACIVVPFPWESRLSGQGRADFRGVGWYEREIAVPADWAGLDPVLHFGAVDWQARVWINGRLVAENAHGYLPFACNLAGRVAPGETARLTVRACDVADAATLVGKQAPRWYTCSSGNWQTVWLEGRPRNSLAAVRLAPDVDAGLAWAHVSFALQAAGTFTLRLSSPDGRFAPVSVPLGLDAGAHERRIALPIPDARLWSPTDPYLYDVRAELTPAGRDAGDVVATYFGMRKIAKGAYGTNPGECIWLNDEPIYLRGALDQAFHPDGLHAYPSDAAIRQDIALARELGLNMLRCHIKINHPRYYYWADRLGLIIHYDMPSPALDAPSMRRICADTIRGMIARDFNHPSIMLWVLFNETWGLTNHDAAEGQAWVRSLYRLARALDPTRLVEDNSPCHYDHVETDVNSWHFYVNDYARARAHVQSVVDQTFPGSAFNYVGAGNVQGAEPLMNSEYGGISAAMGDMDISWCFKYLTTELRRHARICGYVYTELTDVEWEHNGFVKYDRSRKGFGYEDFVPDMTVADLNAPHFVGLDCPPCQTLVPGAVFAAPLFVSAWGPPLERAAVKWEVQLTDRMGRTAPVTAGTRPVRPVRFDVAVDPEPLSFRVGSREGLATVALRLVDETGACLHRNYVNLEIAQGPAARASPTEQGVLVRFAPHTYRRSGWPLPVVAPNGSKVAGQGAGFLEYAIDIPPSVALDQLTRVDFICELGARASMTEKLSWPPRHGRQPTPQTMEKRFPAVVDVRMAGIKVAAVALPDDPADARGVLSHYYGHEPGSYGYLHTCTVQGPELQAVMARVNARRLTLRLDSAAARGFSLYGERAGRYPVDPVLVFRQDRNAHGG